MSGISWHKFRVPTSGTLVQGDNGLPRNKISQKWPDLHYFRNCGHIMPKHKTKIYMDHIQVMIDTCVNLEKTLRWYILEMFEMAKIVKI